MPNVAGEGEFYPPQSNGGALLWYPLQTAQDTTFSTPVAAGVTATTRVFPSNGFSKIAVGLTATQSGNILVNRYLDESGQVAQGAAVSIAVVGGTPVVLNVVDGKPFGSFTVAVQNTSGAASTISALSVLVSSV